MTTAPERQVIFVGGTSYSGSTFFHMILANDPSGFAVGELRWLSNPTRPYHVNRLCSCGERDCDLWPQVRQAGDSRAYEAIFELKPEVRFIVDSSKNPFWISRQTELLAEAGVQTRHILIWKSPQQIHSSMSRRGRDKQAASLWINYHLLYFTLIQSWRAVSYSTLVQDPHALRAVCKWLGIAYFAGKEEYWNKVHHIFGGNRTSRFHLYSGQGAREQLQDTFDEDRMRVHRKIYNSNEGAERMRLEETVGTRRAERAQTIVDMLLANDVSADGPTGRTPPRMSQPLLSARQAKYHAEHAYGRWRFGSGRKLT